MGSFYRLLILCNEEKKKEIDAILGFSKEDPEIGWSLIIEAGAPEYNQSIPLFIDLMEKHLPQLKEIGIPVNTITFWYMYEYEDQCNMAFGPDITRRIGELGIALCVTCWEK